MSEAWCQRCGRPNVRSWHAPSPLWNAVLRNRETGEDAYSIVCPSCFAEMAEPVIGKAVWCFKPHDVDVSTLWVDGDGREWDVSECLWISSKPTPGVEPGTARLRIGCSTTELSRQEEQ